MSKTARIVLNVIYYILTFALGLFIAITLPVNNFYKDSMNHIINSLRSGEYEEACRMIGGYYDRRVVKNQIYDDGGDYVIFPTLTQILSEEDNEDYVANSKVQKSYTVFLFNLSNYNTFAEINNQTKIKVNYIKGGYPSEDYILILDFDNDENSKSPQQFDEVASKGAYDFIYIEFPYEKYDKVVSMELIDKDGLVYKTYELNLDFHESFFTDCQTFIDKYNHYYSLMDSEKTEEELNSLNEAGNALLAMNENYKVGYDEDIVSHATKRAVPWVILYFVVIYIIGDSLIGLRLIIKFFKWLLTKVFKVKFKEPKRVYLEEKPKFGQDYFSKVTISLNLEEAPGLDSVVTIGYNQEEFGEIWFSFNKNNLFIDTKRVHAGIYHNPRVEIDDKYQIIDMPESLEVEGYNTDIVLKVILRNSEDFN